MTKPAKRKARDFTAKQLTAREARVRWATFELMLLHEFRPKLEEILDLFELHKSNSMRLPEEAVEIVLAAARPPKPAPGRGKHAKKTVSAKEFRSLYMAIRKVQAAQFNRRTKSGLNKSGSPVKDAFAAIKAEDNLERKRLEKYAGILPTIEEDPLPEIYFK